MVGVTGFEPDADSEQGVGDKGVAESEKTAALQDALVKVSEGVQARQEAAKPPENGAGIVAPQELTDACAELAKVVAAWPKLKPSLRDAILTIVQAGM
jgi:hypothetical protein